MDALPLKSKIGAGQTLKISPFKQVIKPTVPHKHAGYFELIILSDGAGEHIIDDTAYEVLPPVLFFLKPGQTHCWDFSRIPKGFVLLFKEELLNADDLAIVYQIDTYIKLIKPQSYLPLVSQFYNEYCEQQPDMDVLVAYLRLLIRKTAAFAGQSAISAANTLYFQFKSLLNTPDFKWKKVHEYAAQLHVSANQLNLICRKATGKSPSVMLNERIMMEAKTLLANTVLSIKEIAYYLHFTDSSHFVKFFKTNANITPGEYRDLALAKS